MIEQGEIAKSNSKKINDAINPDYYKGKVQPIDLIQAQGLDFALGSAIKYICRAGKKTGNPTKQDLEKAIWYLKKEIEAYDGRQD